MHASIIGVCVCCFVFTWWWIHPICHCWISLKIKVHPTHLGFKIKIHGYHCGIMCRCFRADITRGCSSLLKWCVWVLWNIVFQMWSRTLGHRTASLPPYWSHIEGLRPWRALAPPCVYLSKITIIKGHFFPLPPASASAHQYTPSQPSTGLWCWMHHHFRLFAAPFLGGGQLCLLPDPPN